MKKRINQLLNWFEEKFNFVIELLAFLGGVFCILFALFVFAMMVFRVEWVSELAFEVIILPGAIGFFGVIILFALRITRYMTQK
jgi:hypothetical protein